MARQQIKQVLVLGLRAIPDGKITPALRHAGLPAEHQFPESLASTLSPSRKLPMLASTTPAKFHRAYSRLDLLDHR